jgi:hypothetical protein
MLVTETEAGTTDCRSDNIWSIRRILSADRHGEISAILVTSSMAEDARVIVDHCWHDAAVIVADDQTLRNAA